MSEIDEGLQPLIDKWWAGLTPEERGEWWEEGDFGSFPELMGTSVHQITRYGNYTPTMARFMEATPPPCAQLWWKLEAWLGDSFWKVSVRVFPKEKSKFRYDLQPIPVTNSKGIIVDIIRPLFERYDRRHALLDACLAVQRGEG